MGTTSYAIALGSNRRHGRHGDPRRVVEAAFTALVEAGLVVTARSAIRTTPAMGVAGRRFANAAIIVDTELAPLDLLALLKRIERQFGRRPARRWAPRVLDLDILFQFPGEGQGSALRRYERLDPGLRRGTLILPHPGLAARDFVLQPLEQIAPNQRQPGTGLTVRHLRVRLHRAKPVDRSTPRL